MKRHSLLALLLSMPSWAFAHPGHGNDFVSAFAHPLGGIDHLLMMVFVGVWAARIGGNARWQLPLSFIAAMTIGFALGARGIQVAGIESGIAAGLIALGVLMGLNTAVPRPMQIIIVALFALLHGIAHGAELNSAQPLLTVAGFVAATTLLHGVGVTMSHRFLREYATLYRALGIALSLTGTALIAVF